MEKFYLPYYVHLFLIIKLETFPKFIGILVAHRFSITQSFNAIAIVELLLLMVSAGNNSFSLPKWDSLHDIELWWSEYWQDKIQVLWIFEAYKTWESLKIKQEEKYKYTIIGTFFVIKCSISSIKFIHNVQCNVRYIRW